MGRHAVQDGPAYEPEVVMYARVLALRHLQVRPMTAFVLGEGAVFVASLLALCGVVSWWGVILFPLSVAAMVKFNDTIEGRRQRA